jgi:hypothetical protein
MMILSAMEQAKITHWQFGLSRLLETVVGSFVVELMMHQQRALELSREAALRTTEIKTFILKSAGDITHRKL